MHIAASTNGERLLFKLHYQSVESIEYYGVTGDLKSITICISFMQAAFILLAPNTY